MDEKIEGFMRRLCYDDPGLLSGDGVTLEQVASFAEAASSFARAEPWRHLEEEDVIHVEAPESDPVRFASVLGSISRERGILFLSELWKPGAVRFEEPWLLRYADARTMPSPDLYLWERYGLALAGENDLPWVSTPADGNRRPDAGLLDRFEAILRALAVTTEDEMDSGRWEKTVETSRGSVRVVLSLPDLLNPPQPDWDDELDALSAAAEEEGWLDDVLLEDLEEELTAAGARAMETGEVGKAAVPPARMCPEWEAQLLVDEAWEVMGRRRVALARRALALWPDCADAWSLLAERERDPERAVILYTHAMAVAERGLDPLFFEIHAGSFREIPETRPYLRARLGLADALWEVDRCEEAVAHFQELLRLDPMDSRDVRSRLVDALLLLGRDGDAARVLAAYPGDTLAHSLYSRALLAFRREGDSPGARKCLTIALTRNRFVPEYLLAEDLGPDEVTPLLLQPGDRSEAVFYAVAAFDVWERTPGAFDWLRKRVSEQRRSRREEEEEGRRKRRGRG